jgi:uncharacterized protein YllA (UPF0747 family)
MATATHPNGTISPLESWASLHPAALAFSRGELTLALAPSIPPLPRSPELAAALVAANRRWGNDIEAEISAWLAGADVVVTGQQPGLLGGPLLTLIKAAAVAAEVTRRKALGRPAVGFLWLATADDDLPEMGWTKIALGEDLVTARETDWQRGGALGGLAPIGLACAELLGRLADRQIGAFAGEAIAFAKTCYAPGTPLGEATARFLARLLASTGVVILDALEPAVARAAQPTLVRVLQELPQAWQHLRAAEATFVQRGWPVPIRLSPHKLPVFARRGLGREPVSSSKGPPPVAFMTEVEHQPERFIPNVWLRPLIQDAALGTTVAVLGGAELAYHLEAAELWQLAGVAQPLWHLRPHVTVVTAAERRLARQLSIEPDRLLRPHPPRALLGGAGTRRKLEALDRTLTSALAGVSATAKTELPSLGGDVDATSRKLTASVEWLRGRAETAATRDAEVTLGRWRRLQVALRPNGKPQERELSVLSPLLRLGLEWPRLLVDAIDPTQPGMHLLHWHEGASW